MNKKIILAAAFIVFHLGTVAQDSTKVCEPLTKTFYHLQKNNLNVHLGGGYTLFNHTDRFYHAFNTQLAIQYLPMNYLEAGYRIKSSFLPYQPVRNRMTLEQNIYLRKHLLFSPCSRFSVFSEGALNTDNSKVSYKGSEKSAGQVFPSLGFGLYKMINSKLQFTFNTDLFFGHQPNRINFLLQWNLKNFRLSKAPKENFRYNLLEKVKQ